MAALCGRFVRPPTAFLPLRPPSGTMRAVAFVWGAVMLDLLRNLIGRRRVLPTAPDTFSPVLATVDVEEISSTVEAAPDLESIGGIGCIITYKDSGGDHSVRRITCRRLSRKETTVYLQAFCHEREAVRTFRLDRIEEVCSGETGEVFRPAGRFFEPYHATNDGGAAVGWGLSIQKAADLRASLNVLAFLARADGHFCPNEVQVVAEFARVFAHSVAGKPLDHEAVAAYAQKLAPDGETFFVALQRIGNDGAASHLGKMLLGAAAKLVQADGELEDSETLLWETVEEYLDA